MKSTTILSLWIVAFSLKMIGASWDAAFHFKFLRETTQAPHIVNTIGLVLACFLWLYMARQAEYKLTKPLRVSGLGFLVFFIGIPLDEAWHRIFGIDLTTWSITHAILYSGTALMIAGIILQAEADYNERLITRSMRNASLLLLCIFVLEAFWFPLLQQEQGVISYYLFEHHIPIASKDILVQFHANPRSQIYGGIPDWLYGAYASLAAMIAFRIIRYFNKQWFACTIVALAYVGFRAIANFVYHEVTFPESTVPYFLVTAALFADLIYRLLHSKRPSWAVWTIIGLFNVACIYSISYINPEYPIHPPMPHYSIMIALLSAIIGYGFASWLLGLQYWVNTTVNSKRSLVE